MALLVTTLMIISCGLNENEKTSLLMSQQIKDDSIRFAEINQIKKADSLKAVLRDSLIFCNDLLNRQQNSLIQLKTSIYTANDEMTTIKAFHFGRLPEERETEVRNNELKIQSLILQSSNLQVSIQHNMSEIFQVKEKLANLK